MNVKFMDIHEWLKKYLFESRHHSFVAGTTYQGSNEAHPSNLVVHDSHSTVSSFLRLLGHQLDTPVL